MISKLDIQLAKSSMVSPHLTLWEAIRSVNHPELVVLPTQEIQVKLQEFGEQVFEPVRLVWGGRPVAVDSMYRNPRLNKAVGGTVDPPSVHQIFEPGSGRFMGVAGDLVPGSHITLFDAFKLLHKVPAVKTGIIYPAEGFIHTDSGVHRAHPTWYISEVQGEYRELTPAEVNNLR